MKWLAAALLMLAAMPASALTCAGLDSVLAQLLDRYGESRVFQGVLANGAVIITAAPDGGGFTVLLVTPQGDACHIADGVGWAASPPILPGKEG